MSGTVRRWISQPRARVLALAVAVLCLALGMRLHRLGSVPTVFFHDECDNAANAMSILQGRGPSIFGLDWKPQPALAVHLIALSLRVFEPSVAAIRLPSALLSVAALAIFLLVARRVCGWFPALLGALLLMAHPGYLHFSRSGWENVQISLYTLVSIEAILLAEEKRRVWPWALAGAAAGLGALVYFAGRAIVLFLGLYGLIALAVRSDQRRRTVAGIAAMSAAFICAVGPVVPTIAKNWPAFNMRTDEVVITRALREGASAADVARTAIRNGRRSVEVLWKGAISNEPRYYPVGRPLLDRFTLAFLVIGVIASLSCLEKTGLWWVALGVPFVLTQMLTVDTPNFARGIGLLPVLYLFVALGLSVVERPRPHLRAAVRAVLLAAVSVVSASTTLAYWSWADSDDLSTPLAPAVALEDFPIWWEQQNAAIAEGHSFNVGQWLTRKGQAAGTQVERRFENRGESRPSRELVERRGEVHRGSTTSQPYEIPLGSFTIRGSSAALRATVFAVPGSDAVYDYLRAISPGGYDVRAEAEDWGMTRGDRPVSQHEADDRWWRQDYADFSGGQGLVALRTENPPPLVTEISLPPGTYDVRVGSFTGDPANGVFALQVFIEEVSAAVPAPTPTDAP